MRLLDHHDKTNNESLAHGQLDQCIDTSAELDNGKHHIDVPNVVVPEQSALLFQDAQLPKGWAKVANVWHQQDPRPLCS